MLHRSDNLPVPLGVQALYSVAALARAANVHPRTLRRVLHANHIQLVRAGRATFVPLSEIQRRIPALWESVVAAETARVQAQRRLEPGQAAGAPRRHRAMSSRQPLTSANTCRPRRLA